MRVRVLGVAAAVLAGLALATPAVADPSAGAQVSAPQSSTTEAAAAGSERVVSGDMVAGGYPGAKPAPGACVSGHYDANYSETALARRPGTEQLVGAAKAFFGPYSTDKAQHTAAFTLGATTAETSPVGGFDCVTTGSQDMPPSWTNVTDPNLDWDTRGRVQQVVLAYNAYWGTVKRPNGNIYSSHSDDGGRTWVTGNGGRPVQAGPSLSTASSNYLDKPWVTVQQDTASPYRDHVYGTWVEFPADSKDPALIHTAVSRDRGDTWSRPLTVPQARPTLGANPWPQVAAGADGTVYLSYVTYTGTGGAATLWSTRSTDDGASWGRSSKVADTTVLSTCCLPGTHVHDGAVGSLAVDPTRPGHLTEVWEELSAGHLRVRLATSRDGGSTWSRPRAVDDPAGVDRFQPQVAIGPGGAVVVAFYDKRWHCPSSAEITPGHRGAANTCIGVSVQAYRDNGSSLRAVSANTRLSPHVWDPAQPAQVRHGLPQHACEDPTVDCDDVFLGDYFDLEVSGSTVYVLSTSTHYPGPGARADDGGPIYYQRAVLDTVSRARLGL